MAGPVSRGESNALSERTASGTRVKGHSTHLALRLRRIARFAHGRPARENALSPSTLLGPSRRADTRFPCLPLDDDGIVVEVFHTYILRCADGALYIGNTENLDSRVNAHNAGEAALFTRKRRPVALVYAEVHPTRLAAVERERQIKRWTRAKKEALICGDLALLKRL